MKVCQEIDVDNVTIIINPQNKLEAKIPTSTPSEVVIEEVTGITNYNDAFGTHSNAPFGITKGGQHYPITKVGRIAGTNWLVFQADNLFTSPTSKPTITKNISLVFYDDKITGDSAQTLYEHSGKVRVIVEDGSEFIVSDSVRSWQGEIDLNYQGDNGSISGTPYINFVDKTYSVSAYYNETQTTSALQSAIGEGSFTVERDDVIYIYNIIKVKVETLTPEWTPVEYCEQNEHNPVYDETYNGVRIQGSLPANVTEVRITLKNGDDLRFPVNSSGIYKYNLDAADYYSDDRIPQYVTPVTATGELERKLVRNSGNCSFIVGA